MGEDFALHGRWSIAKMVKQVLACWRRLKQKTMKPTMPRVGLPSGFIGLQGEPLRRASCTGIRNGSNAMKKTSGLRYAVVLPEHKLVWASVTSVTPSPCCTHGRKLVLGANARSYS